MAILLLRNIDYWLGIPLCFIFTIVHYLRCWWRSFFKSPSRVKKILVIKLSELGAIVLSYPMLNELKSKYPDAEVYFLTFKKNKGVFNFLGNVIREEHVLEVDDSSLFVMIKDFCILIWVLWRKGFDVVIDLEFFSRAGAVLTFFSGAAITVGFYPYGFEGLYRGDFLTHKISYNPLKHVSVNFYALILALENHSKFSPEFNVNINEKGFSFPEYKSTLGDRQVLLNLGLPLGKNIFLINTGEGGLPLREWPLANFETVVQHILRDESNIVVFVGTESAQAKANELFHKINSLRIFNCSGKTNLLQLMELFLLSKVVIANDCGLMHLAMLTPIKKIVLFGPETPQVFGPLGMNTHVLYSGLACSPCLSVLNHRKSFCRDNVCLKSIESNKVIALI